MSGLLEQLSQQRVAPELEAVVGSFAPGAPLPVRLTAGRDAALATLRKYVPDFRYDPGAAEAAMRDVEAWESRNGPALEAIMASGVDELPEQLELSMGAARAQSFVLSSFTQAAAGLGPWQSGAVARLAADNDTINETWARQDAAQRLQMFALIVKLDQDGSLRSVFEAPSATGAFGAVPLWFVVVLVVIVAAAIVTGLVLWRRIELNNRLMRDICERAQREGDQHTVDKCLDATRDLQISGLERAAGTLAWGLVAATGVYVGLRYVLPWAVSRRSA